MIIGQKIAVAVAASVLVGCIFSPEEPPLPEGRFVDRLNLRDIVAGTSARFDFNSYRELLERSDRFYCDYNLDCKYSSDEFLRRINTITSDTTVECFWSAPDGGEKYISMDGEEMELSIREFRIISDNILDTIRGKAKITIRYGGTFARWQIVRWEEADDEYSYFHPHFGGVVGN